VAGTVRFSAIAGYAMAFSGAVIDRRHVALNANRYEWADGRT